MNQKKDPRKILSCLVRIPVILFAISIILIPLFMSGNFLYLTVLIITGIILSIIISFVLFRKISFFPVNEYVLHESIKTGYGLSVFWFFLSLISLFIAIMAFEYPLFIAGLIFLSLSIILFYFADKSEKYEKKFKPYKFNKSDKIKTYYLISSSLFLFTLGFIYNSISNFHYIWLILSILFLIISFVFLYLAIKSKKK